MFRQFKTVVTTESLTKLLKYAEPKVQRLLNDDHVHAMVCDQEEEYTKHGCFSMVQSVTVAFVENENNHYILDGHHRLRAYSVLAKKGLPISDVILPVVVYNVRDTDEMMAYYLRINKNMPIHPLERCATYGDFEKVLIERFTREFALYIKDHNGTARCPHISLNELKRHIDARLIGMRLLQHDKTVDDLWNKMVQLNSFVSTHLKHVEMDAAARKRIEDCEAKARSKGSSSASICYLGFWRHFEWLDACMLCVIEDVEFHDARLIDVMLNASIGTKKRRRVPAIVRQCVWKKTHVNVSDTGECFVCKKDLFFADMECAHIVAHALGGQDTVENMMPACKTCNRDMGIMNLMDYKRMLESMLQR